MGFLNSWEAFGSKMLLLGERSVEPSLRFGCFKTAAELPEFRCRIVHLDTLRPAAGRDPVRGEADLPNGSEARGPAEQPSLRASAKEQHNRTLRSAKTGWQILARFLAIA